MGDSVVLVRRRGCICPGRWSLVFPPLVVRKRKKGSDALFRRQGCIRPGRWPMVLFAVVVMPLLPMCRPRVVAVPVIVAVAVAAAAAAAAFVTSHGRRIRRCWCPIRGRRTVAVYIYICCIRIRICIRIRGLQLLLQRGGRAERGAALEHTRP
jgi:hypothetical protein